ncbi:hypothetical protein HYS91_01020 [Candidatus Daviesbacteria bacterium]|nr:hypothetical protein [Candidatus Daviesbacteria bacterium]
MATPEARTEELFSLPVDTLSQRLEFQVVEDQLTGHRIQLSKLQPWARNKVGETSRPDVKSMYHQMREFSPGDWCAYLLKTYKMRQSLIVAADQDGVGAYVRIIRASRFDPSAASFILMPREGDIANLFQMQDNERARLTYLNETNILYLIKRGEVIKPPALEPIPTDAPTDLEKLLEV